jgi:hypothetical protein
VELHAWTPSAPEHDTVEYLDRLFGCARETVRQTAQYDLPLRPAGKADPTRGVGGNLVANRCHSPDCRRSTWTDSDPSELTAVEDLPGDGRTYGATGPAPRKYLGENARPFASDALPMCEPPASVPEHQ